MHQASLLDLSATARLLLLLRVDFTMSSMDTSQSITPLPFVKVKSCVCQILAIQGVDRYWLVGVDPRSSASLLSEPVLVCPGFSGRETLAGWSIGTVKTLISYITKDNTIESLPESVKKIAHRLPQAFETTLKTLELRRAMIIYVFGGPLIMDS